MNEKDNQSGVGEDSEDTIFSKIIKGEIPAYKVYEDEDTLAFLDIMPNSFGHTLVIPKNPARNIYEIEDVDLAKLILVVKKVAIGVKKAMSATGINVSVNNDIDAGQEIFHLHFHVIPRFPNDNFAHGRHLKYEEVQIEEVREKVKASIVD